MKPGKPLRRVTPLRSSSSLTTRAGQLARTPMRRTNTGLVGGSRLRQVSPKRMAQQPSRRRAETLLGRDRYGNGICARCGQHGPVNGHERRGRGQGGDPSKPDCLLCVPCNTWCEDWPAVAAQHGWKLSRKYRSSFVPGRALRADGETLHHFEDGAA